MSRPFPRSGLYAIVNPDGTPTEDVIVAVTGAIAGGMKILQYRAKRQRRPTLARRLLTICRQRGIPLIINDDIPLAKQIGADGVHLGREDEGVETAREALGNDAIIGISCYDSLQRAQYAQDEGATYVAFGCFFPSTTKPDAAPASAEVLRQARSLLKVPIVAIGGITPENGRTLLAAGADLLAVASGVFETGAPQYAAKRYATLFEADRAKAV